jgi:hypothetical protein
MILKKVEVQQVDGLKLVRYDTDLKLKIDKKEKER